MSEDAQTLYLQQLRDDGQNFRIVDIDGVIPVRLLLISDVA